jgi:hypothetical protein
MKNIKKYIIFGAGIFAALTLITVGTVWAKGGMDEKSQKANSQVEIPVGERFVDRIGIVPPGFDDELQSELLQFQKNYENQTITTLDYMGYKLIIPPAKNNEAEIQIVKNKIDEDIKNQDANIPAKSQQDNEINKIRSVFNVEGSLVYNNVLGAYTDEKGFQYNFENGELVSKIVSVMPSVAKSFAVNYPYLKENGSAQVKFSDDAAFQVSDPIIEKLYNSDKVQSLKETKKIIPMDQYRVGVVYGDNDVNVLFDKVSGDIISYSKVK